MNFSTINWNADNTNKINKWHVCIWVCFTKAVVSELIQFWWYVVILVRDSRVKKFQPICTKTVRIIALLFTDCKVNSSYCNCRAVNHMKIAKQFSPKENLVRSNYVFPHYIFILFIHCILLSKEILLIPTITWQNAKNALQFLMQFLLVSLGG